jgi:hypothetical protein
LTTGISISFDESVQLLDAPHIIGPLGSAARPDTRDQALPLGLFQALLVRIAAIASCFLRSQELASWEACASELLRHLGRHPLGPSVFVAQGKLLPELNAHGPTPQGRYE